MRRFFYSLLVLLVTIPVGNAGFKIITLDSQAEYIEGKSEGIQIDPDGRLSISGSLQKVWCSDNDSACWALASDSEDIIYAATGNDGKVYALKNNDMKLLFDAPQMAIFSLLPLGKESILAGAAPDGIIYKILPDGQSEIFARTETNYIWDMTQESDGNILVATGLPGQILRIGQDGTILNKFELKADHVRKLLIDQQKNIWIGTASPGRIYQLTGNDIKLVHDSHTAEINSLVSDEDKLLFSTVTAPSINGSDNEQAIDLKPRKRLENELKEHGNIWALDLINYSVREIMEIKAAPVFSMVLVDSVPVIACGNEGYLVSINETRRATLLASLAENPVVSLICSKDGTLWAGSAGSACLYKFLPSACKTGTFTSDPLDTGKIAQWGRFVLHGTNLTKDTYTVETHSGNTDDPDDDWSDWASISSNGKINSPPASYLQWRLTLSRKKSKSPFVETISISLKTINHPPYIKSVKVFPVSKGKFINQPGRGKSYRQILSNGMRVEYVIPNNTAKGISKGTWFKLRGMRTVMWNSGDEDKELLEYKLEIAQASIDPKWFLLDKKLNSPVYSFDSTAFPDGNYYIKVTASDQPSHPINDAMSTTLRSSVFMIDNTPPEFINVSALAKPRKVTGWKVIINGTVRDNGDRIAQLEYSLDSKEWFSFTSTDAMLDSPEESFELIVEGQSVEDKPQIIFLRVVDSQENLTSSTITVD